MSTNQQEELDDTQELIANQNQMRKDQQASFGEEGSQVADQSLDDAYLIELLGRLTMIKNELDYNRITNYVWLIATIGMCAVIQVIYNQVNVFIAMAFVVELELLINIVFIFSPLYFKLFIV